MSWLLLHKVKQDKNPKGVVALLTLSASNYIGIVHSDPIYAQIEPIYAPSEPQKITPKVSSNLCPKWAPRQRAKNWTVRCKKSGSGTASWFSGLTQRTFAVLSPSVLAQQFPPRSTARGSVRRMRANVLQGSRSSCCRRGAWWLSDGINGIPWFCILRY